MVDRRKAPARPLAIAIAIFGIIHPAQVYHLHETQAIRIAQPGKYRQHVCRTDHDGRLAQRFLYGDQLVSQQIRQRLTQ